VDNNEIRLGLIGCGTQGTGDTNTALRVDGIRLTAVCDLFDDRLAAAKERWGDSLFTTKDYRELLKRKDVDAVIVATPDHWHLDIAVGAMKAGKHVYCEKPVIHKINEAKAMINAQQTSGVCFQAGSQGMASLGNRKARQLVLGGIIGKVNFIDGQFSNPPRTNDSYRIPETASEKTIWWSRFLGKAPRRDFDAQRFLYWRNWKDYSTGIAGDLFVHVLASLHYITDAQGPEKVYTTGGIYNKLDSLRDTPDIMLGYFNYPDRNNVGAFTVQLGANYVDGVSRAWGSMNFLIVGSEGKLRVEWNRVTLTSLKPVDTNRLKQLAQLGEGIDAFEVISPNEVVFKASEGYKGGHYDHFSNFFSGIRNRTPIAADVVFGVQSAAPALLCYESYLSGSPVYWDAGKLEMRN
jgi:predicted dehydrogenase